MKFIRLSVLLFTASLLINSCVKQDPTAPPSTANYDPNLPVQATIKNIATMGLNMNIASSRIMGDTTISGIVVANDKSGNIYKQIMIEDASKAGVVVYMDKTYLYSDFPVGRKVYVKLKGLTLTNYKGLPEIVFTADVAGNTTGIPSGLIGNYVIKASYPNVLPVEEVSIIDIKSNPNKYLNTLVKLTNVQFDGTSNNVPYAQPSSMASGTSRTIEDCSHTASVVMYNSGYASFQSLTTPKGNGTLYCICSQYVSTVQLLLRDTTDVQFNGPRCP